MKILDSPLCASCGENETLMHMLASCPNISVFWSKVSRWWNVNTHSKYRVDNVLDEVSIMYGYELHDHNFYYSIIFYLSPNGMYTSGN